MKSTRRKCYDVFINYRGLDTGNNFTDHLFGALRRKDIFPFRDNTILQRDESLTPEVIRAINDSRIVVVVFSRSYASSRWCLQELKHIFQCSQISGKRVLPIFYDVDPSDVLKQSGAYGEAFARYEQCFQHDPEKVRQWREALTHVANLSGWDLRDRPQYREIENIVDEIIYVLNPKFSSVPNDLVGMDSPIEELKTCLLYDSIDEVRVVGICGIGGIGKTTLATVLYCKMSHQFDACCFIEDVRKIYEQDGPIGVQKQILHQTQGEKHNQIYNLYDGNNLIQSMLCRRRALIILDNVNHIEQLEKLALNRKSLAAGSRIIIVCRDAHILEEYGVDALHTAAPLNLTNSLQLLFQKAFKCDNIISNDERLTSDLLNYANGLPLAIKVLGSFLFGRDISEWKSSLARLRDGPDKDVMDVLELNFDGLDESEKEIFLHIACFFNLSNEKYVTKVLNCCGFHADIGLKVLIDKSLISIVYGSIVMHGLLEELGRKIVQENSSKESRKWSRLWFVKQVDNVMLEKMESNVEAVVLYGPGRERGILIAEALSKMNHLTLLILKEVKFSGSLNYLSKELRYVEWEEYPFLYLPSSFQLDELCELILVDSSIEQLWKDKKYLPNLRTLDLSYSQNLIKLPDFGEFPNLKWVNLEGCVKLVQIDSSIGLLRELVYLNLNNCENLICIPNEIFGLTSLKYLNLCGCSKAFNNPNVHEDFSSRVLPSLPSFSCLSELDISFCHVSQIPDALGCLPWLERLNLRGNNFVTLPSLQDLSKLEYLNLEHCKQLTSLPELPSPPAIKQYKHKRAGMYIFNCPELVETEQCSNMPLSWMMHFIQVNQDSLASFHQIDIVIPGIEMPKWFNYRKTGRSISMDPSPIVNDNDIIGIAFCAVFSVEPFDPTSTRYEWGTVIRLGFKSSNAANSHYVVIPVTLYRHLITVKSNHTWLIYFDRELFFSFLSSIDKSRWELDDIKLEASVMNGQGLHLEVKNCGYRWVFK